MFAAFLTGAVRAEDGDATETGGWFARADAVVRFNVKATLEHGSPTMATGVFNNGYVLPDATGSQTETANWGYTEASQIAGGNVVFNRFENSVTGGNRTLFDDPVFGGEVVGGYRFEDFVLAEKTVRFSLQGGYGYSSMSQSMGFAASGTATYTTESHSLNGIVPPPAPYSGHPQSQGPLISLPGTATSVTSAGSTSFQSDLEADFHTLRFGAGLEVDWTKKFTTEFGAGLASIISDTSFKYTEVQTFTNPSIPGVNTTRTVDDDGWDAGFYIELLAVYKFTDWIGAFVGADFQYNTPLEFGDAAHKVKIDLSSTYAAKAGITVSF